MKKIKKKLKQTLFNIATKTTAVLGWVFSVALILSFITYSPKDVSLNSTGSESIQNWCGLVGSYIADIFLISIGVASYLIPIFLSAIAYKLFKHKTISFVKTKTVCLMLSMLFLAIAMGSVMPLQNYDIVMGGVFGAVSLSFVSELLGGLPQGIISIISGSVSLILILVAVGFTPKEYKGFIVIVAKGIWFVLSNVYALIKPIFIFILGKIIKEKPKKKVARKRVTKPKVVHPKRTIKKGKKETTEKTPSLLDLGVIEETNIIPPISLLDMPKNANKNISVSEASLQNNAEVLMQVLNDYGVNGEIVDIKPGPVVTL
jgi:DNA segregation ATPase FtsK/SpoIIIE, S-DNA-T family